MRNVAAIICASLLGLILQTAVAPKLAIFMQKFFLTKFVFAGIYFNTVIVVLSYVSLTRKAYEALMWSLFLFSLTNAFGIGWGSSMSIAYIFISLMCLAFRQSVFISGYTQKFILCFAIYVIMFLFEHWLGGVFERKSSMLSGEVLSMLSQSFLYALCSPWIIDILIWIDSKTLSKLQLQDQSMVFAQQREGLIATF